MLNIKFHAVKLFRLGFLVNSVNSKLHISFFHDAS